MPNYGQECQILATQIRYNVNVTKLDIFRLRHAKVRPQSIKILYKIQWPKQRPKNLLLLIGYTVKPGKHGALVKDIPLNKMKTTAFSLLFSGWPFLDVKPVVNFTSLPFSIQP